MSKFQRKIVEESKYVFISYLNKKKKRIISQKKLPLNHLNEEEWL